MPDRLFEFNGGFPRYPGCPECGAFGFPDGYDADRSQLYFCEVCCQSYNVRGIPEDWDRYWEEEDKYLDWERYYEE